MIGALVAVGVGWGSILLALRLPLDRWITPTALRRAGAAALAVLALDVLGAPLASWHAFAVLTGGVAVGVLSRAITRRRGAAD